MVALSIWWKKLSCINPVSHIFKMFLWMIKDVVQNLLKIRQYLLVAQKHESNIQSFVYSDIGHIIAVDLLACFKIYSLIFWTSSSHYASFSSIFSSSFYAKCTKLIPAADLERGRACPPPPFGQRTNGVAHGTPDMWQHYCIMVTLLPLYLFKNVKHGTQNIKNDCHQWLCDSFRVH